MTLKIRGMEILLQFFKILYFLAKSILNRTVQLYLIGRRLFYYLQERKCCQNEVTNQKIINKRTNSKTSVHAKSVLDDWYKKHESYPYASAKDIDSLSLITNLEAKQIRRWLENKRKNKENSTKYREKFSMAEKTVLKTFFQTKSNHPGPQDLHYLQNCLNKDEKKIRAWFNHERFKMRHNCY